jgi:hypothetical protein
MPACRSPRSSPSSRDCDAPNHRILERPCFEVHSRTLGHQGVLYFPSFRKRGKSNLHGYHRHQPTDMNTRLPVAVEIDRARVIPKCQDLEAPEPAVPRGPDAVAVVIFRLHRSIACGASASPQAERCGVRRHYRTLSHAAAAGERPELQRRLAMRRLIHPSPSPGAFGPPRGRSAARRGRSLGLRSRPWLSVPSRNDS